MIAARSCFVCQYQKPIEPGDQYNFCIHPQVVASRRPFMPPERDTKRVLCLEERRERPQANGRWREYPCGKEGKLFEQKEHSVV